MDALGNVDGGFDAVVAKSTGRGGTIDGSAAIAAKNSVVTKIKIRAYLENLLEKTTYVAPVRAVPICCMDTMPMSVSISMMASFSVRFWLSTVICSGILFWGSDRLEGNPEYVE